jgi:predicted ATPase/class 3 adenylate cyclase
MTDKRTATFLFSDIEGSTAHWQRNHDAMMAALERHDRIARDTLGTHGGTIFKHTGDGVCAIFSLASAAVTAATAYHRGLMAESWAEGSELKVRIGIHTGEAEERDGDYFGPVLSRVARLMDAAHGGQTLVSGATGDMVTGRVGDITLQDLGEHRFKDLGRQIRVFQALSDGLPTEFPAIRSLEAYPNNLPDQLTTFVGRNRELREISDLIITSRLVTLTGIGGVGKTRLAVQAAAELIDRFPHGVWLVELAPVTDPTLIPWEIATALGVAEEAARPLMDVLIEHLADREALIVLDNCEHLIDQSAKISEQLLQAAPGLRIVATSREGLAISGERLWRVPSLAMGSGAEADAIELFVERARMVKPDFAIDPATAEAIFQICMRLDGIPLAIELATARLKVFTPNQIAQRLDDRFRLLTGGSRTALPRQRTLQATMDWSYDLLSGHEKTVLRRLAVFHGGFDFEAAEEVGHDDTVARFEVLDLLTHLIESSMIAVDEGEEARYRLLETVRQYSLDRLVETGEADIVRRRHAEHFRAIASRIDDELLGPDAPRWMRRLELEQDNFRGAMTWALEHDAPDLALGLAEGLGRFWFFTSRFTEGRDWLDRALSAADHPATVSLCEATNWAGSFALHQGDYAEAEALIERGRQIADATRDEAAMARTLNSLGNVAMERGRYREAIDHFERCLDWARRTGSNYGRIPLMNLGIVTVVAGDFDRARTAAAEIEDIAGRTDDVESRGWARTVLGFAALWGGDLEEASEQWTTGLDIIEETNQSVLKAWSLGGMGEVNRLIGDGDAAEALTTESLTISQEIGSHFGERLALATLGRIAADRGDTETAMGHQLRRAELGRLKDDQNAVAGACEDLALLLADRGEPAIAALASIETYWSDIGYVRPAHDQTYFESVRQDLRDSLGPELFDGAWRRGIALTPGAALAGLLQDQT